MNVGAQGEILFRQVEQLPDDLVEFTEKNKNGEWIISHSEKGNHHLLECDGVIVKERTRDVPPGVRILYAIVENPARLYQDAATPHEAHTMPVGYTEFRIAREFDPILQQARQVAD